MEQGFRNYYLKELVNLVLLGLFRGKINMSRFKNDGWKTIRSFQEAQSKYIYIYYIDRKNIYCVYIYINIP